MKTAVRRVLLMSALMSPGALYALGLGEIHLNSALNQPFDAEIELVSATQEDLGALRAALASSDTFSRYGLDRPAYLADFNFRVTKGPGGKDLLRVTSPKPVTEPFVTLLVEANWPRGRLLREYTVLLDPPVFAPGTETSEPVVAAPRVSSGGATSVRAAEPVAAATAPTPRAPQAAQPVAAPEVAPGSTYTVRRNDTLWTIASAASPGSRSNVNRAMVAIFQNNPQAFDGNINVLRSGSTLRIPDASQIQAIPAAEASAEVARQYDAWRGGQAAATAPTDAGRLRLVPPEQGSAAPSTATAPAAAAAPAAAPAATAAKPGSTDLESRVQQLESELAEARRLLEVRNAELATLQGGTAAPAEAAAPVAGAATAEGAAPAESAAEAPAAGQPEATAPAEAAPAKPAAQAPEEPAGPTLLERLQEYWWVLLGLLAAALGVVLFQRVRRERGAAEENLEAALATRPSAGPVYTPRSRESAIVVEEKRPVEASRPAIGAAAAGAAAARAPEPSRKAVSVEDTLSGEGPGGMESGDPLAEADFHMAYGLYDQAADLVQLAIKREPQRRDLKLKLLEIFFVWGNRDRFLELARELGATRGDAPAGEWDKVLIMGKQIAPEDAMFAGSPRAAADSLDMELHGSASKVDLDIGAQTGIVPAIDLSGPAAEGEVSRADSSGIDFILDEPLHEAEEAVAPTVETPRVRAATGAGDTQELTVDRLGLDVDSLRELEALDGGETVETPRATTGGDTVEAAVVGGASLLDEEADLLTSTALMRMADDTALIQTGTSEPGVVDLSEATGELPSLDATGITKGVAATNYDLGGEPATMSEVGTKLDLARAYIDMGDPEGARSILDEVLQEGNSAQRKEAERLISSLP
jgi:pilus assembly protein FimV